MSILVTTLGAAIIATENLVSFVTKPLDYGFEYEQAKEVSTQTIYHSGFSSGDNRQAIIQYAYEVGGINLVTTIECENGTWGSKTQSSYVKNGIREPSFGFCQISRKYHPEIVNDPRFRNDWKWQIDKCNELLKGGTVFYGRDRKINGKKCSEYVLDRFTITNVIY